MTAAWVAVAIVAGTLTGVPVRHDGTTPTLQKAVVVASVVSVDPADDSAVFRVACGWHVHPTRKLKAGLWKVSLRGVTLSLGPMVGPIRTVRLTEWFEYVRQRGWSGWLALDWNGGSVASNGATTDICHGVFP